MAYAFRRAEGLTYHVLQTQGAKQSISIHRDYLSFSRLADLTKLGCNAMVMRWRQLLGQRADKPIRPGQLAGLLCH